MIESGFSTPTGLLNGASGKTHQDLLDLSIMRAMPNMTILAPADDVEADAVTRWAADHDGPVYLRLARDPVRSVFLPDYSFSPKLPVQISDGSDLVVVSTGVQTSRVCEAIEAIRLRGVTPRHLHLPMLKPLDEEAFRAAVGNATLVVTIEDHTVIGGLGGLVSEILSRTAGCPRIVRLGLADGWSESGPNDFLLDKYGLSAERVAESILSAVHS